MSRIKTQLLEPIWEAQNYEFERFDRWNKSSSIFLTPEEQEISNFEHGKEEAELLNGEGFDVPRESN
jgi:hypothetical protein